MVASCYRRSGDYTAALQKYKWIHQHFPDDIDCMTLHNHLSYLLKLVVSQDNFISIKMTRLTINNFFERLSIFRQH